MLMWNRDSRHYTIDFFMGISTCFVGFLWAPGQPIKCITQAMVRELCSYAGVQTGYSMPLATAQDKSGFMINFYVL